MSQRGAERSRLSTYEVKAVTYQNDSLPDSDTPPDEAQQNQGIDKSPDQVFAKNIYLWFYKQTCWELGVIVQQFVFHRESPVLSVKGLGFTVRQQHKCSKWKTVT